MLPKIKLKNFLLLISSILIFSISCKSSYTKIGDKDANYIPYYLKVYEADSLSIVGNYQKSYEILDSLFKKYEPIDMDIYYEYKTYLISKHKIREQVNRKQFEKLILKFGYDSTQIMNNEDLKNLFVKCNISDNSYTNLRNQYLSGLDLKLRQKIISMKEQDQKYRTKGRSYADVQEQNKIDSLNTIKMISIFENIGFPNKSVIGGYNVDNTSTNCSTILLHTKDSVRLNYFVPKIKELITKGNGYTNLAGS